MRWVWAAAAALLWPQLTLLGGVRARREPKRPRKPGQHPAAPNATTSSSEGLLGFPKVCRVWAHVGAFLPPAGSARWTLQASPPRRGAVWIGPASRTLSGPGEGWRHGGASQRAALHPSEPQGPSCPGQPAAIRRDCKGGGAVGSRFRAPAATWGAPTPAAGEAKASLCLTRCWAASTPYGLWHGTCSRPGRPPAL